MTDTLESALLGEPYDPNKKVDAVALYNALVAYFTALPSVDYFRDDLTDLNAITGEVSGEVGAVLIDGTSSNNGIYTTNGTTWTKVSDLPPGMEALSLATVATTGDSDDLSEGSTNLLLTVAERAAIAAATSHAANTSNPHSVTAAQIGVEASADVTDSANVGAAIDGMNATATISAADTIATWNDALSAPRKISVTDLEASLPKLSGIEDSADVTDAANVGSAIDGMTATSTPVDADTVPTWNDGLSAPRKVSFANFKATLLKSIASLSTITIADADSFVATDDSASDAAKAITWSAIKAAMKAYTDTLYAPASDFTAHEADLANPHVVTKTQVGLGNADNTSDANKPISDAAQTALDAKLTAASDLSDVASASTARTNLGLGTAAVAATGDFATAAQGTLADSAMQQADLDPAMVNPLAGVGGTGSAYTATGPDSAYASYAISIFSPSATNTADTPTLNINGEGARDIVRRSGNVGAGRLVSGVPVLIQRIGTTYRMLEDADMNVVRLTSVTSADGLTYTASTSSRGSSSLDTLFVFKVDKDNTGNVDMVVDGTSYDVLDTNSDQLAAGVLSDNGGYYMGIVSGSSLRLIGTTNPEFVIRDELKQTAIDINRIASSENALLNTGSRTNDTIRLTGARVGWTASYADIGRMIYATNSANYVDVRNIRAGADGGIMVRVQSGGSAACEIFTSYTTSYTLSAGDACRVYRDDDEFFFETVSGSAPVYDGSATLPVADVSIITAWQSIAERFADGGGAHGLQVGWDDWSVGAHKNTLIVDGATGGTGLVPYSDATGYWWDDSVSGPGPSATAWKAALDAMPAGQPDPVILIIGGQTDSTEMGDDATMSMSNWKTSLEELIYWMRQQIDGASPDTVPVFLAKMGSKSNNASPTDAQYSAINWIYQEIIDAQAYTYEAGPWWDLHRSYYDSHIGWKSSAILGYRLAGAIDNALYSGTNGFGPYVSGITEMDSGLRYRLTLANDPGGSFSMERPENPDGFAIYASGEDPLSDDPLEIDYMEYVSGPALDIYLKTASAGATVMFPAGVADYAQLGRVIRNILPSPTNKGLGNVYPLKSFKSGAF